MSERPGVHDERVALSVQQNNVEHIERVDRSDAFDQRALAMAIQRLKSEATCVHLAALAHELLDLTVEVLSTGERFVAQLREAALHPQGDAGAVEQDGGLKPFSLQTNGLQHVDQAN